MLHYRLCIIMHLLPKHFFLHPRYLQQGLGLDTAPDKPIVACITRLVPQKVRTCILKLSRAEKRSAEDNLLSL